MIMLGGVVQDAKLTLAYSYVLTVTPAEADARSKGVFTVKFWKNTYTGENKGNLFE